MVRSPNLTSENHCRLQTAVAMYDVLPATGGQGYSCHHGDRSERYVVDREMNCRLRDTKVTCVVYEQANLEEDNNCYRSTISDGN